jgi:hypothetical protein
MKKQLIRLVVALAASIGLVAVVAEAAYARVAATTANRCGESLGDRGARGQPGARAVARHPGDPGAAARRVLAGGRRSREASRAAHRALRLAHTHPPCPRRSSPRPALTVARIAQDGDDLARSRVHLNHAVDLLEADAAGRRRDRVLAWALVGAGDEYRRRGEYPAARRVLDRALRLVDPSSPATPGCTPRC